MLQALHSRAYRQELARRISQREGIKYSSAMRRLQRYVTEGGEKRSFQSAPALIRQSVRQVARAVPIPKDVKRISKPEVRPEPEPGPRPSFFREIEPAPVQKTKSKPYAEREHARSVSNFDFEGIVAYHDGDSEEAAETLGFEYSDDFGLQKRFDRVAGLLELASKGTDILGAPGSGDLIEPVREFFEVHEDAQDVEDWISLIGNLPDWQREMIIEDMQKGNSTFDDWLDRWHSDGMIYRPFVLSKDDPDYEDAQDNWFWELWRAAYAKAKA